MNQADKQHFYIFDELENEYEHEKSKNQHSAPSKAY